MGNTARGLVRLLAVLLVAVASCGDDDGGMTGGADASSTVGAAPETATITISDFAFGDPATVAVGGEVTIANDDAVSHTWTADDGSFDTGGIAAGDSTTVTLDTTGDFSFHCAIHPTMTGSITVEG